MSGSPQIKSTWLDSLLAKWSPGDSLELSAYHAKESVRPDAYLTPSDCSQIQRQLLKAESEFGDPEQGEYWCSTRVTHQSERGAWVEVIVETVAMGGARCVHIADADATPHINLTERVLSKWRPGEILEWRNLDDKSFDAETPLTEEERHAITEALFAQPWKRGTHTKEVEGHVRDVPHALQTLNWQGRLPLEITRTTGPILKAATGITIRSL